jgi:hypothetical protein
VYTISGLRFEQDGSECLKIPDVILAGSPKIGYQAVVPKVLMLKV